MRPNTIIVEFLGTFFLVLTIGMAVIDPGSAGPLAPLAIGSVLAAMIYAGGHVSGAHFNPGVTLAALIRGTIRPRGAAAYVVGQCAAGVAGSLATAYLKEGEAIAAMEISVVPALFAEFAFTFALAFVVLNVATAKPNAGNSFYGIAIALTVVAGAYAVGPISGGAFNPAVAVALGVLGVVAWSDLWIHVAGEAAGAVAAAYVFAATVKDRS